MEIHTQNLASDGRTVDNGAGMLDRGTGPETLLALLTQLEGLSGVPGAEEVKVLVRAPATTFEIRHERGSFLVSDRGNPNRSHLRMGKAEAVQFTCGAPAGAPVSTGPAEPVITVKTGRSRERLLAASAAFGLVLIGLSWTLVIPRTFSTARVSPPESPLPEARQAALAGRYQGWFASGWEAGETVLHLPPGQAARLFEMTRAEPQAVVLDRVEAGPWRFVTSAGAECLSLGDFGTFGLVPGAETRLSLGPTMLAPVTPEQAALLEKAAAGL